MRLCLEPPARIYEPSLVSDGLMEVAEKALAKAILDDRVPDRFELAETVPCCTRHVAACWVHHFEVIEGPRVRYVGKQLQPRPAPVLIVIQGGKR